jgi:hypothetical protein
MEIPPPQYLSFPFIPLIPKQALRGAGPEYSTREEGGRTLHGAAFALTRCTTASDTVPNTTHPAVPDPPRHTTRREMRGPDSRDHEFRSPHCIFACTAARLLHACMLTPAARLQHTCMPSSTPRHV